MRKVTSSYIFFVISFWVSTGMLFGASEPLVFGNKSSHIVVIPPPVTAGTFPDVCRSGKAFLLTGGSPSGGYYTGQGVINGFFYPSSAGAGTHTITYTVYVGGVPQTATTTIKVNPSPAYPSPITSGTLPFVGTNGLWGGSTCPNGGYAYSTPGCTGKTENYIIPPEAGTTYKWEPSSKYGKTYSGGGSVVGSNTGNSVDIKWDSSGVNKIYTSGGSRYYYSLFKVTATNSFGCTDSFFLFFQINIAPKADFTATTVCVGNETQFTDNSPDATQWFWDFGDGTTSTEKNPKHVFTTGGPHTVKLTTKSGCYCETTVTKTVNVISTPAPKVTCPSTFCPGTSSSYSTDPVCGGYNWVVNGGTIASGQGTPNITVNWGPNGPTGTVSLTTSGCNPNQCSSPTTNTVPLIPPVSSITGKIKVCQYESATYTMPSFPGSNVSWSIVPATAGTIVSGQGTNSLDVTWNTSGNAKIVVTIDHAILGCKSSTALDVIILPYFSVSTTTYSLCKGGSGTITASPTGGMTWSIPNKKGTITSGQGTGSVVINWPYAGSHIVVAKPTTANKYCNDSSYTYVYVDSVRPPSVDGPLYICPGSTYKYTSLGPTSPYSYNWTATNGTITSSSGNDVWIQWGATGPYSFTVKQNNGYAPYCSSAPLVIPVYDLTAVPPPIKGKDSTCVDNTYTYSVPYLTGATYAWSISPPQYASIITGQGTSAISLEFSSAGTAVITCKTTMCPTPMISTFTVIINPSPKPPISSVGYMCPTNGSVTLSTSPGYATYSWSPSGGTGQTAVVNTAGYFIVYVKGKNGCVGKEKIEVPMQEAPMAHISSEDPHNYGCIVPNTVNTTLRALQGGGNGSVTYQWYHKGTAVGANSPSYTALDSGKYWLVVTNSYGCITTSNPFYISRISCGFGSGGGPPGPPGNGSSSSGAVGAAGAGGVGAGDLRPVPVGGGDKFGGGASTMSNISSGLGDEKVLSTQIICVRNIQFTNTSPDVTDRWSWEFGDFTSIDTNENPLHLYAMPGYYYITFWTHFAPPKSGWKAQYIPIEIPYKAAFKYKPNCGGAIFTDKSMHTTGSPINNWNWDFGDGNTSTAQNPNHTYAAPGTYTVVLSISGSVCTRTTSQTVTIPPKPTAEFSAPSACITFPTKFTDASIGTNLYEWKWDFGDGYISNNQNPYHTYGSPGNYTVKLTVTDVTGCSSTVSHTVVVSSPSGGASITANGPTTFCRGGTVLLTATAAASYQWSNGATSQYILVNQGGYYSCTITFATGCVVKIPRVFVNVLSTPSAYMYSNVKGFICSGTTASYYASYSKNFSYQWYKNGVAISGATTYTLSTTTTGIYRVHVVDNTTGCFVDPPADTIKLIQPSPTVPTITGPGSFCDGTTVTLTGSSSGGTPPLTYQWTNGSTQTSITVKTGGTQYLTVQDKNGCYQTANKNITLNPKPNLNGFPVGCYEMCKRDTLRVLGGMASYQWYLNGTAIPAPKGTSQNMIVTQDGAYSLIAKTTAGCIDTSAQVDITTKPLPVVNAGLDATICVAGGEVDTLNGTTDGITYNWTPTTGLSNPNILNPVAKPASTTDYILRAKGSNGCKNSDTVKVTVSCTNPKVTVAGNITCKAGCVSLTATGGGGGVKPYAYKWSSGQTGLGPHSVCPASTSIYTVTITDAAGNTGKDTALVVVKPGISSITSSKVDIKCKGAADGTLSVTPSGGIAPYTYSWSTGASAQTITGLSAMTYSVSIIDSLGCKRDTVLTIVEPDSIKPVTTTTPAACGGNNGSMSVTVTGGSAPYTYSWSPLGGTGQTAANVPTGNYVVTITDASNCSTTTTAIVNSAGGMTGSINSFSDATCNGGANGSASVITSGGTSPLIYSWSPIGGTGGTANNLSAGTYTVTVTDVNNCVVVTTVSITEPAIIGLAATSIDANCGNSNGSATVAATGGTGAYTYLWTPGGAITATASGLSAGSYDVSVTDASGCSSTTSVAINNLSGPTVTTQLTDISCFGANNGTAQANPTGGSGLYTYSWQPSGSTTNSLSGLSAGTYTINVNDGGGCLITSTVTITEPVQINVSVSATDAACGSANGSAVVTASGGSGALAYSWQPSGGTGITASNLAAATYTVVVTDANNCSSTQLAIVNNIGSPAITVQSFKDVSCNGLSDGDAAVTSTGGISPYTYSWSSAGGTGSSANNLSAGIYSVTVTDANNCAAFTTVIITEPPVIQLSTTVVDANCGGSNGSATVTSTGGTGSHTYLWTPGGATSATANGLSAGSYDVLVTDSKGCTTTISALVNNLSGPTATKQSTDVSCNGSSDGTAQINATGGTGSYTYSWQPGGNTTTSVSNLSAGIYTVNLNDAGGCLITSIITITEPPAINVSVTVTDAACGAANGSAVVTASGGSGTLAYSWQPSGGTGITETNLAAATYTVVVTDANNCSSTQLAIVNNIGSPAITVQSFKDVSCNGFSDGDASVASTGGISPYTYSWSSAGGTGSSANNLSAGIYSVTVTDANNCAAFTTVTITEPTIIQLSTSTVDANCGGSNGSATVTAAGGTGSYNYSWTPGGGATSAASGLSAGSYDVLVTDANGCTTSISVLINNLNGPSVTTQFADATCNGSANGTAQVSATGGAGSYAYSWQPSGNTGNSESGLSAGTYTVNVSDGAGCLVVSTVTITEPPPIVVAVAATDGTCGAANGSAVATVTGTSGVLTYNWSPTGGTGDTATLLVADTYTIIVTDANGCSQTTSAIVGNTAPVAVTAASAGSVSCNGGSDGSAIATTGGGTSPFTFAWSPSGGAGVTASALIAGTYTVSVTDSKGCTSTSDVIITEPAAIILATPSPSSICIGQSAALTASASGGTPTYIYSWMPGSISGSNVSVSPASTTTYTITVSDANGCTSSAQTVTVDVKPPLQLDAGVTQSICVGGSVTLNAAATGGDGSYSYNWLPMNSQGATVSVTPTGTTSYTVVVTDGCGTPSVNDTVEVKVNALPDPTFVSDTTAGCEPVCIQFNNTTLGTSANCLWDFGDGSSSQNCSPYACYRKAGDYTVKLTVTDSFGCSASITKTNYITVYPLPTAAFKADPKETTILTPNITFTDKSSTDVVKWDWSFGDLFNSTSTDQNPTYTYQDTGRYEVQLLVTTQYGCTDTATDIVVIHADYTFYVPNAFSPNGDGVNETFFPKGFMINPDCYKMNIFDRWGLLIFSTSDLNIGWDGRAKGGKDVAQQDVYEWKIETCDYMKRKYQYIGHVTLVK